MSLATVQGRRERRRTRATGQASTSGGTVMLKKYALMAALVLVLVPATAKADWLFTPNVGTTFKSSTNDNEHFTYGASIGWMGAGIVGWEADFSYTPEFFAADDG